MKKLFVLSLFFTLASLSNLNADNGLNLWNGTIKEEFNAAKNFEAKMQGYIFADVRVKGPHADVYFNGRAMTEAKLNLVNNKLVWKRFADRSGFKKDEFKRANTFIAKLIDDSAIMNKAKQQVEKCINDFQNLLSDPKASKKERELAERGLEKFQKMHKLF